MKHISILVAALMTITLSVLPGAAQDASNSTPTLLVTALDDNGAAICFT